MDLFQLTKYIVVWTTAKYALTQLNLVAVIPSPTLDARSKKLASKPKESNRNPYPAESEQKLRFFLGVRAAPSIRGPSQVVSSRSGNNPTSCGYERANRYPFVHQQMRKVFLAK